MIGRKMLGTFAMVLLLAGIGCSTPLEDEEHGEAVGVDVTDSSGALLASYRTSSGSWTYTTSDALEVPVGGSLDVRIYFVTSDGDRFQEPASGAEHTYRVVVEDETVAEYHPEVDQGHFDGVSVGETEATVELVHGGHSDYTTNPGMTVRVVGDS